ncbi:Kef family K(+) transporter [Solimonas sp. K1W22B-7]|uniref:YbaL family putative K(+) efflux transporter n=1 Tax=Solimonas sp. K1W22B-7 TaxID=2303331 RepID=UPI000E33531C|nr:YbaL family putative K(+) efflux transporter [Solimonas sp. K1W22B-7]AXQ29502.1 Kef family K(+) transporter [Solimonas sp. K1W22B-7]
MPHHTPLIATIVMGLVLAFIFGALAHRLRLPPLAGYLLAGIVVGPFTPGFVADPALAPELAEIGVILLMFGVGLHFSLADLMAVKRIAIPGAIAQMAVATLLGMALAWAVDWPMAQGFVFGLALSVASTVVLLRALEERRQIETNRGRIAVGWLIVEDLAMVLALVLLPALAGAMGGRVPDAVPGSNPSVFAAILLTLAKVAAFVAFMLIVGRRLIPGILHMIARTGSKELFRLAVLAVALGVAFGSAQLFGVSFALGAFFAGMVLSESELSSEAAQETLPLRDAFAVLFFVSVGMLFNPSILVTQPWLVLAAFLIIVLGKSLAAMVIVLAFKYPRGTALTIAASLAQIGEFSFILATLGVDLGLLTETARDVILAAAIFSIIANPFFFIISDRLERRWGQVRAVGAYTPVISDHVVVVGYGRVGSAVVETLQQQGTPFLVIEEQDERVQRLRERGIPVLVGNAAQPATLRAAQLTKARTLILAVPNAFEAGQVIQQAREVQPELRIFARAHSDAEVDYLRKRGASFIVMGEREIARSMVEQLAVPA